MSRIILELTLTKEKILLFNFIAENFGSTVTNFLQFYEFFMTISINSVECERIFSAMNFIKDKKKANLTVRKLYQRLLIYIHGPILKILT